jgi:hypothetical protein
MLQLVLGGLRPDGVLRLLAVGDGAERGLDLHLAVHDERWRARSLRTGTGGGQNCRLAADPRDSGNSADDLTLETLIRAMDPTGLRTGGNLRVE